VKKEKRINENTSAKQRFCVTKSLTNKRIVQARIFVRSRYAAHQISPNTITAINSVANHGP
jgi:hypothetical protein